MLTCGMTTFGLPGKKASFDGFPELVWERWFRPAVLSDAITRTTAHAQFVCACAWGKGGGPLGSTNI